MANINNTMFAEQIQTETI